MKPISVALMRRFVKAAGDQLHGNWIVMGGAVLPLTGIDLRVTVDIDIAGPATATQAEMLILMEIATNLGLPIEAINQAGAFFLHKISGWEKSLIEVYRGKSANIFRPDVNLFILLKLPRLSETDLQDCLAFLKFARLKEEPINDRNLVIQIKTAIKNANEERVNRLKVLLTDLVS